MVKIVKRFISERCIGYTKEGYSIYRCEVEHTDGTTATLYRTVEHTGRIYGLAASHPPIVTTNEQATLFEVTP